MGFREDFPNNYIDSIIKLFGKAANPVVLVNNTLKQLFSRWNKLIFEAI